MAIKNTLKIAADLKVQLEEELVESVSLQEELQGLKSFDEVIVELEESLGGGVAMGNRRIRKGVCVCVCVYLCVCTHFCVQCLLSPSVCYHIPLSQLPDAPKIPPQLPYVPECITFRK